MKNRLCQVHGQQCEKRELKYNVNNVQNLFCTNLAQELKGVDESGRETTCLSADVIGCLLFHHSQQLSCNVHAIKILQGSTKLLMIGSFKRLSITDQFSDEFLGKSTGHHRFDGKCLAGKTQFLG